MRIIKGAILTLMMLFVVFSTLAGIGFAISFLLDLNVIDGEPPSMSSVIFARITLGLCLIGVLNGLNKVFDIAVDTFKYGFNHESITQR